MRRRHEEKKVSNANSLGRNDNREKGRVRYKECRKNHAANIGGYAVDGCREFMASGEEGSAAFKCAACNCHRNFHKREVLDYESDSSSISNSAAK